MFWVFLTMGDYTSAEKVVQHIVNLGVPINVFSDFFSTIGKTYPGAKEIDPLYYYRDERFLKRDFTGIIALYDTTKLATIQDSYFWKATAYHQLEIQDSVKVYGQLYLDNIKVYGQLYLDGGGLVSASPWIFAMLGNKEKALNTLRERNKFSEAGGSNIFEVCFNITLEIALLSILGDFQEATDLLINLNRSHPNYGLYGVLINDPRFDKIKSEYPPFADALNKLKLPPKLDLEGLVKL